MESFWHSIQSLWKCWPLSLTRLPSDTMWDNVRVSAQLCLMPWDPMDRSPSGSSVHGTVQARMLEWVAISSSRGSSQPRD